MYIIDKERNEAIAVERKSFKDLNFNEVQHLQEWIAKNPSILGEELLIIQKEFSDFEDTSERLDLLAIDKSGNLVIIENKLDDSGRDVTWQALKYVSYCSTLSKSEIVIMYQKYITADESAEESICSFLEKEDISDVLLNNGDQRIILVAANFRKEVTSTVMWLIDHNIKIKCIKITPYMHENNILIDAEQIIPIKDAEDYQIKLAHKKQEEMLATENQANWYNTRIEFWNRLLPALNEKTDLYKKFLPSGNTWWACGDAGFKNTHYNVVFSKSSARVDLSVKSRHVFDNLYKRKNEIEQKFGDKLEWESLARYQRVAYYLRNVSLYDESDWDKMIHFLSANIVRLVDTFKDELEKATSDI